MLMFCFNCAHLMYEIDETFDDRPLKYFCTAKKNTKLDKGLMHLCCMNWVKEN